MLQTPPLDHPLAEGPLRRPLISRPLGVAAVPLLMLAGAACRDEFAGAGDLRAQRVVLEREVEGLREVVGRLERGAPMLPADDVVSRSATAWCAS